MKKTIIFMLLLTLSVTACTKHSPFSEDAVKPVDTHGSAARISVNACWTEYRIKSNYESSYAHWCQLWASPLTAYEKQNSCGPACYMLAAHMVAQGNGYSFMPSSGSKLLAILSHMGILPISMDQIGVYVTAYDKPPLTTVSSHTADRNEFKDFLFSHLGDGDPIIVPIVISNNNALIDQLRYCSELQSDNYDLDSAPQSGRQNYVLTSKLSGGWGHFVVVIGISVYNATGNGLVYYKDPLSSSGATKVCSFTRFLESAKINGDCTEPACVNYDAIVIKKL